MFALAASLAHCSRAWPYRAALSSNGKVWCFLLVNKWV